jgi:ABC-type ATPase involved in cell division
VDDVIRATARDGRTVIVATHHAIADGIDRRELTVDGGRIVREVP